MNVHDYRFLLSEQGALKQLLEQTSPANIIGRKSLESRLRQVEEELETYEGIAPGLVSARITFRGSPVVGSRGILADFGNEAFSAFTEAVTQIGASHRYSLSPSGRIPNREQYQ